jgi:hypothetical protein
MHPESLLSQPAYKIDLVECLKVVVGEMKRLPVLWHWHDAKQRGLVKLPADLDKLVGDACMDSMLLTIRALDDFYRLRREQPRGKTHLKKAQKDDLYAEEYGFICDDPVLPEERRQALNKELAHFTHRRATQRLRTVIREDVFSVLGPSIQFLSHVLSSGLLENHHELAKAVQAVRDDMQTTTQDPTWGVAGRT